MEYEKSRGQEGEKEGEVETRRHGLVVVVAIPGSFTNWMNIFHWILHWIKSESEYFAQNIEFNIWLESNSLEHPAGVNGVKRGSRGKEGKWVVWEVLLLPRGYLLPFYLPLPLSFASWGALPTLPPYWSFPPPHLHLLAAFRVMQMIIWSASKYLLWFF